MSVPIVLMEECMWSVVFFLFHHACFFVFYEMYVRMYASVSCVITCDVSHS
uniref:Uncharacterized protein n=1 Tax=Arundo donax TaxID=35708 RepID=A0A0A8ZBR8_ARUDO